MIGTCVACAEHPVEVTPGGLCADCEARMRERRRRLVARLAGRTTKPKPRARRAEVAAGAVSGGATASGILAEGKSPEGDSVARAELEGALGCEW
ncbi:MAG: hypothetical protein R8K47_03765 [Mariprofundaceae bacterium]